MRYSTDELEIESHVDGRQVHLTQTGRTRVRRDLHLAAFELEVWVKMELQKIASAERVGREAYQLTLPRLAPMDLSIVEARGIAREILAEAQTARDGESPSIAQL